MVRTVGVALGGFLLGGFPTGYLVGRVWGKDVRLWGSGRTGGTNVLRTCGPVAAAVTVLGDVAKAVVAIWLSSVLLGTDWGRVLAGSTAVLGHIYTPFLSWRGGRGVATALAVLGVLCLPCAAAVMVAGAAVVLASRYVSLASLTTAALMPVTLLAYLFVFGGDPWWVAYGVVAALAIWVAHRDNLVRLLQGTERRLGEKATPVP
ncbi:MAG: glycerol-3-phosphate acyltransferase [Anaerolineae bacterium]|nr:glycerol-3-phosphate acyltransferase [Anaerolineae bacterium]